jgi:hypothetical protein
MTKLTVFLAKLIGLYASIVGLIALLHKQETLAAINALGRSPGAFLIIGLAALIAGLAIVLRHNIWSGGPLAIIVTLLGWFILLRALLLALLPPESMLSLLDAIGLERFYSIYMGGDVLIGLWLTYSGFKARVADETAQGVSTAR